ncbi:MAG TPA: helicase C-terminal domain-containing protein [Waddliaceae bacterium]
MTRVRHTQIDKEKAVALLQIDGALSSIIRDFEPRDQQQSMLQNIIDAYNENQIALIEAGTGTGKSIAYLIPALLWAVQNNERTLISTHTINLQEQLIHKDIPLAIKALGIQVKAVLVKGMSNYICLRKVDETRWEKSSLIGPEANQFEEIETWSELTHDGSLSDLAFVPSRNLWEKVCAEADTCNQKKCPFFKKCHFFKARRAADEAQILVANHSLLFADLACRLDVEEKKDQGILPDYSRIILDEAHNIEDVATEFFAKRVSHLQILRLISRLGSETQGKLSLLNKKLHHHDKCLEVGRYSSIHNKLTIDLPGIRRDLLQQLSDTFQSYHNFIQNIFLQDGICKWRILPCHLEHPEWTNEVVLQSHDLIEICKKYVLMIKHLDTDFDRIDDSRLEEQLNGLRHEVNALARRLEGIQINLESFISKMITPSQVRWVETQQLKTMSNYTLIEADIDVAKALAESLFSRFPTITLCSATLTTNQAFDFIKKRLGLTSELLPNRTIRENIYSSPFDYSKQALLGVPLDMPDPSHPDFVPSACEKIWSAVRISQGNAFILFTSYAMLTTCYDRLQDRLTQNHFCVLKQGDATRKSLLEKFKATKSSVLFGTDSFWQGVDVAGDALRCVVLVKLPFKVPTEPLMQARTEAIAAAGGDPFYEYSVPNAIVKFKQGFGRLIRNNHDRGCILCLDPRIATKRYGKLFLNSLPPCRQVLATSDIIQQQMVDFYRFKPDTR